MSSFNSPESLWGNTWRDFPFRKSVLRISKRAQTIVVALWVTIVSPSSFAQDVNRSWKMNYGEQRWWSNTIPKSLSSLTNPYKGWRNHKTSRWDGIPDTVISSWSVSQKNPYRERARNTPSKIAPIK